MTIFTIEREESFTAEVEVDFGQGGDQTIDVEVYDHDIEVDVTREDIEEMCPSEAEYLADAIRDFHGLVTTKEDVIRWLVENLHELGGVIDDAVERATTPPMNAEGGE